jgi:hypothetical protein
MEKHHMRKIVWEAWQDPLNGNAEQFSQKPIMLNQSPMAMQEYDGEEEPIFGITPNKVVGTPHGLLSITENTLAANRFEFWIAHTNFDITKEFIVQLEQIAGVETVEVFTRYRMRIGFPISGLFKTPNIKYRIEELIHKDNEEEINQLMLNISEGYGADKAKELKEIYQELRKKMYWALYLCPNGNVDIVSGNDNYKAFCDKTSILNDAKELVGGFLVSSED